MATDLAVQSVCFDDMIELANINLDNRGGDKESVNSEISLGLEISESDKPIETFAIGMSEDAIDLKYARQVADYIGSHQNITVDKTRWLTVLH